MKRADQRRWRHRLPAFLFYCVTDTTGYQNSTDEQLLNACGENDGAEHGQECVIRCKKEINALVIVNKNKP
jgi:hypothetical protein